MGSMSDDERPPVSRPNKRPVKIGWWRRWLLLLTVPFVGVVLMLAGVQRSLIYYPFKASSLPAREAGLTPGRVHDVTTTTEDDLDLHGWLILAAGHRAQSAEELEAELARGRLVTLYFGGNAANRSYRIPEVEILAQAGADVLIFDFRGYGENDGSPNEEGLARDARAVWRFATETKKIDPKRIVLFGESLGGGVAVRLASELCEMKTPPGGLILRSTFSSLSDVAASHFPWLPVRLLLIDRFPSEQRIPNLTCPVLQFHGRRDTIIPFELGRRLHDVIPETSASGVAKRFVELPNADHNDVIETSRREMSAATAEFFQQITAACGST